MHKKWAVFFFMNSTNVIIQQILFLNFPHVEQTLQKIIQINLFLLGDIFMNNKIGTNNKKCTNFTNKNNTGKPSAGGHKAHTKNKLSRLKNIITSGG